MTTVEKNIDTAPQHSEWIILCALSDLEEDTVTPFEIDDNRIAIYLIGGKVHATDNVCSHAFALLSDGWLEGTLIECPLHGAQFEITSGEVVQGPADCPITVFKTKVEDGQVLVRLPVD
ncbi:non-heme iron oxygenase ferredoxin subunit [Mesorhizobium sp. C280B]|uniref:non-heme iron oxygenase ferredoxin subunit n=1 Tax=unclassified Mesorhizobium TaxID=325217 RepID=UPI0003CE87C9|nr:non-heme iron oxygenase ferredoxin subunit [Mesorhizobium sp. LSJC280B00]ESW65343.1 (2Fe-2S)-binding protein [Mesorhizobium sp. LSJC280B00]